MPGMELALDPDDLEIELVYELDYNEADHDDLDLPWFAPTDDDLIAHLPAPAAPSPLRAVAAIVGIALAVTACVGLAAA
jgi:hypothetical protein